MAKKRTKAKSKRLKTPSSLPEKPQKPSSKPRVLRSKSQNPLPLSLTQPQKALKKKKPQRPNQNFHSNSKKKKISPSSKAPVHYEDDIEEAIENSTPSTTSQKLKPAVFSLLGSCPSLEEMEITVDNVLKTYNFIAFSCLKGGNEGKCIGIVNEKLTEGNIEAGGHYKVKATREISMDLKLSFDDQCQGVIFIEEICN